MKFLGRIAAAFSAAVMMFSVFSVSGDLAFRAEAAVNTYYYQDRYSAAEQYIASQLEAYAPQIYIYQYGFDFYTFQDVFEDVILSRTDLFFVEPTVQYVADKTTGIIAVVCPNYYYPKESYQSRKTELDRAAADIISDIDSSWSDVQKALYVHDVIAVGTTYNEGNDTRSAYEVLVGKDGLCVAYAMAYKYIMDKLGIECTIVMDSEINHSWNMIRTNGKWYHVDVTWDDMIPNFEGLVYHDYFMVSDEKVHEGRNPHTGTVTHGYQASDKSMDDMFWRRSDTRIIPDTADKWYYIDNTEGKLCTYSWKKGANAVVDDIGMKWYSDENRNKYWLHCFARLARCGDILYYNSPDSIYSYDITTKEKKRVKRYSFSGTTALYGLHARDGKMVVNTALSQYDKKYRTYSAFKLGSTAAQVSSSMNTYQQSMLSVPSNVLCRAKNGGTVISWGASGGADGYEVYEYFPDHRSMVLLGTTTSLSFTDRGVFSGRHWYVVRAYKRSGNGIALSNYSDAVSVYL